MSINAPRPLILIILDGWGYRENPESNAILAAKTPHWDEWWRHYPHCLLQGSGHAVGLPEGQMGNSEVGHLTIGSGRIIQQDLTRIDQTIENGDFFHNPILLDTFAEAKKNQKAIHLMGLVSPGGVHSHERHLHALLKLAAKQGIKKIYIHAFLDGRDTPPKSAMGSLQTLQALTEQLNCGKIVSIIGRYYAMDRDKRWERIQAAYDLLTLGKANYQATTATEALALAYERGETDEFVQATRIQNTAEKMTINDDDIIIFTNFRSDRAREITQAFTETRFTGFQRTQWPKLHRFVCLSEYDKKHNLPIVFPPQPLAHLLADCISENGGKQLRIAETEKYAHVTFFFNGGVEKPYPEEDRILIPSPGVATYDLQPEMSAPELTERLVAEIKAQKYDVIICNFANPDMVGHTGNWPATVQAIECIDNCLEKIRAATRDLGGEIIITADHGNAEQLYDFINNQPHTAHTSEPIPFLYLGREAKILKNNGNLSDIAPTILYLLNLTQPQEMTGETLLKLV